MPTVIHDLSPDSGKIVIECVCDQLRITNNFSFMHQCTFHHLKPDSCLAKTDLNLAENQ